MKKIIVAITILFACLSSEAQKFLRYQMNNNTYNGFYTNEIESILHDYKNGIATTYINASGKVYEIPINDIDCVSVEDAIITNGDVGQYRIYEFNYQEGDIRKIYVDNRSSLFASHNGDFGANDTILFSSAYNDIACLFYTDDLGRIKKIFDGETLFFVDYNNEDCMIINLSDGSSVQINSNNSYSSYHSIKTSTRHGALFNFFFKQLGNLSNAQNFLLGTYQGLFNNSLSKFAQNIYDVSENPEAHNQLIIVDALSIVGDFVGIAGSVLGEVASLGLTTASLAVNVGLLLNDLKGLANHLWPDSEQMQRYRNYYQNKYSIHVAAIEAENVSCTSATLRGEATSLEGLNGSFSFKLYGENDESLPGFKNNITSNSCIITANASNLKPGWPYFYSVQYTCVVDGLQLVYYADNIAEFMTLSPTVHTGEVQSLSSNRAEVKCQFNNLPEGAICGVKYSCNDGSIDGDKEVRTNAAYEGDYYFNLEQLKPNTSYTYQAFVIIDSVYLYADEINQFTTDILELPLCPDDNHPHMIDLGLPSGTKWACCNVGASKPEDYGNYYTWGDTETGNYGADYKYAWANVYGSWTNNDPVNVFIGYEISGTSYDVAKARMGDNWCLPTSADGEELIANCASGGKTINGHHGLILVSIINGNRIFLPAGGYIDIGNTNSTLGTSCNYWLSTAQDSSIDQTPGNCPSCIGSYWQYLSGIAWEAAPGRCGGKNVRAISR